MRKKVYPIIVVTSLILALLGATVGQAGPPAPEARYVSIRRSVSSISTSMSSSISGYTNTDAKDVCRRDWESKGEIRTKR